MCLSTSDRTLGLVVDACVQAEQLGKTFRELFYPDEGGAGGAGLIRLHSTYRHDLKIYSSDEGRVQMSAAAFTKGLLDLEGELTPILVGARFDPPSALSALPPLLTPLLFPFPSSPSHTVLIALRSPLPPLPSSFSVPFALLCSPS